MPPCILRTNVFGTQLLHQKKQSKSWGLGVKVEHNYQEIDPRQVKQWYWSYSIFCHFICTTSLLFPPVLNELYLYCYFIVKINISKTLRSIFSCFLKKLTLIVPNSKHQFGRLVDSNRKTIRSGKWIFPKICLSL